MTEYALLPPRPPRREPIVAIAYEDIGEPGLGLYNGLSGDQFRQLTGHTDRIRCLTFSEDGRLLASAAEDRTVCVWSLTDLDQILGKRGSLAHVVITEANGGLVVATIDPGARDLASGELRPGDVIQGLVAEGTPRPLASISDFYQALSLVKPDQSVTIRRVRERQGPADVTLRVGQGIDERKPLLSLFVARGDAPERRAWIGWSPLGPYESSGPDAERLLGWHFNTGRREAPTRFALADQYRKLRRPGALKDLIDHGGPAPRPAPEPLPRPDMSLIIDPDGEIDDQGQVLVRQRPAMLNLALLDRRLVPDQVERIAWKVDDSPWRELKPTADRVWSADLSRETWTRGVHQVVATLRTREEVPQEFSELRQFRFQPPPPSLEAEERRQALVVERPDFMFRARVRPSLGPARVRLIHLSSDGPRSLGPWESDKPLLIEQPLTLKPGVNEIELVAENRDALPGFSKYETDRLPPLVVNYNRGPVRPPDIVLNRVIELRDGSKAGPPLEIGQGGPIVVTVSKVRIEGQIKGAEKLSLAEWSDGKGASRSLARFVPDRDASFTVDEELDLAPGPQKLIFRSRAADSKLTEAHVTLNYRPPVPELGDVTLEPSDAVIYPDEGPTPRRIHLKARLIAPADRHPFTATVLVNGKEQPEPPDINEPAALLTAEVALQPGYNAIRVRLSNRWNVAWVTEPFGVTYRRPPRIVAVEKPVLGDQPFFDLSATVESPDDLPLTRIQFRLQGGRPEVPEKVINSGEMRREGASWIITARGVPLEPGENVIRIWAWNQDGPCREPKRLAGLVYQPPAPPPPKPLVEILNPGRDMPWTRPRSHSSSVSGLPAR